MRSGYPVGKLSGAGLLESQRSEGTEIGGTFDQDFDEEMEAPMTDSARGEGPAKVETRPNSYGSTYSNVISSEILTVCGVLVAVDKMYIHEKAKEINERISRHFISRETAEEMARALEELVDHHCGGVCAENEEARGYRKHSSVMEQVSAALSLYRKEAGTNGA